MDDHENAPWHRYIHPKVRLTYLSALRHLSEGGVPAVVVGSAALLAQGYYRKNYWWDIDLLFPHVAALIGFSAAIRDETSFTVEFVDDELQETPELYSLHTLWSHKGIKGEKSGWVNVDLIVRRDFDWYSFHRRVIERQGKFTDRIEWGGEVFPLNLLMAHPWGVFVEKIFSPRVMKELATGDNYSYDARDIFTILETDGADPRFGDYLSEVLNGGWVDATEFGRRFMQIMRRKSWLGYGHLTVPSTILEIVL